MIIAAEFSPPPPAIGEWLSNLAWFMAFMVGAAGFVKLIRGKPASPPNEQLEKSHTNLAERVEKLEEWKETITAKMELDKQQILRSGSERGRTIFEKIEATRKELDGKVEKLSESVEAIPERMIKMFKNIQELNK